jgi:hypothetical protein
VGLPPGWLDVVSRRSEPIEANMKNSRNALGRRLGGERATQLHSIAARHRKADLLQNTIHEVFDFPLMKVWIFRSNTLYHSPSPIKSILITRSRQIYFEHEGGYCGSFE